MATLRIFNLAKELGVSSKAIVAKCQAEGIPESIVKNHMSTVSAGLEASIRQWFTAGPDEESSTLEVAEKVDLKKVSVRRPSKKAASGSDSDDDSDDADAKTATAVADAPPRPAPILAPRPTVVSIGAAPAQPKPTQSTEEDAGPVDQVIRPFEKIASADELAANPNTSQPTTPTAPRPQPVKPAPVNVPRRPDTIKPVAIKHEAPKPVKLSGPKVVRVEAAEPVAPPRRRGPSDSPGGSDFGSGPGGPATRRDRRTDREEDARKRGPQTGRGAGVPSRRSGRADELTAFRQGWSEQDLAERQARLARAGGFMKKHRKSMKTSTGSTERQIMPVERGGVVKITEPFTIKDLSAATGVKGAEIVKKLFMQGIPATINSGIDVEHAQEIMMEYDIELEVVEAKSAEQVVEEQAKSRDRIDERPRGPVVTIMGHVDHGKTSLLDKIRQANVAAGEAGGITQATSAFRVPVKANDADRQVVFIDTPGHEAFTEMRSRGANVTDIVVLVVAADDGVMPQTVESIAHAKAAGVPIVVALNKIDKPEATENKIQEIYGQLAQRDLNPIPWGGDIEIVKTSAHTGEGIQELLDTLDLQAELLELKADFDGAAQGSVIEASHKEGRGAVATILVQEGKLKVGDFIVAGRAFGRVRDITDDKGNRIKDVLPPSPVAISGLDELPDAGDAFYIVDTLKKAQEAAEQRRDRERELQLAQPKVTLDTLFGKMAEQELKEILVVVKADVQGSVDVLRNEIEKVSGDEVKVRVLHAAVGGITESDVVLAEASKAIIVGFNVIPSGKARSLAENKGVEIRTYDVIYHITEDIHKAAEGLLEPELRQEILGHAEVREVFRISKVGSIAGCYVTDGVVQRDALIRVTRGDIVIENDRRLAQLKRFKDDAKEVRANMECGMKIDGYDDIKTGDILECYKQVEIKRKL
ncbi:MAG: translation initiation factor IF-2 [Phycisphaeraceae bacterium]|nr:translation initiation factor IF-2 [Phycisphaerales bacterium]MCB9860241.1 translation initiation factor IF-2 [Phycisphaeraceae bacterium]